MTTRRPSAKQLASRRRKRAEARLAALKERIYQTFLSESSYCKRKEPIPEDAARVLHLDAKWCSYTGYAPKEEGERLLHQLRRAY